MINFGVKDSRSVLPGYIFFSVQGEFVNGNMYIKDAVQRGAKKIIIQKNNPICEETKIYLESVDIPFEYVDDVYYAFAVCIQNAYKGICDGLTFFGVTGTKGKTSTVHILYHMLQTMHVSVAMMSSIGHKINNMEIKNQLTTEMINDVYLFILQAKKCGVTHVVLEVSAQAFSQFRVFGIEFSGFIFNNFSQEHQEAYKNIDDYFHAKCQLYKYMKHNGFVVLNKNDEKSCESEFFYKKDSQVGIHFRYYQYYQLQSNEQYKKKSYIAYFELIKNLFSEATTVIEYNDKKWIFNSKISGLHYISNIVSALILLYEVLYLSDEQINLILENIKFLPKLPGRNEHYILPKNKTVIIDKAYTPNSVSSILEYVSKYYTFITVVFGCGGERDYVRRPLLAGIIEMYAEKIYVTSDNPRKELLENIFFDIAKGFFFSKDIFFMKDRKEAIIQAIGSAPEASVILLLGKGDEQYQIIGNDKIYFCEKDIVMGLMQ